MGRKEEEMKYKKLQDSIELLGVFTEKLKEAVDKGDYVKSAEVIGAIRYRVAEISEYIEDVFYNKKVVDITPAEWYNGVDIWEELAKDATENNVFRRAVEELIRSAS